MDDPIRFVGSQANIVALVRDAYAAGRTVSVVPAGRDKVESLAFFAEILDFPAYVGHNLDALFDALRDRVQRSPHEWELIWDATVELRANDPAAYDGIVTVLRDLAAEAPTMHATVVSR
ncbi:barstar family protein [Nostocoides veronense]|uniref:Barstar (barnase inhibitor) domain-containing protein n=1 Tax=Nostocoides veronense TaxID=330836 RepID=A0ABN2LWD3_9MICO